MKTLLPGLLILTIVVSGLHAARQWRCDNEPDWSARLEQEKQRGDDIDEVAERRRTFLAELELLLAAHERGETDFDDTIHNVEEVALAVYPEYLNYLMLTEYGENLQEKIGYSVLRHFQARLARAGAASPPAHVVRQWESDMHKLLGHAPDDARWIH